MQYDCVIVGGGIAGLQAAVQLGRYRHRVLVIDAGHGRWSLCQGYHNVLGWPDGVSGQTLRDLGRMQAAELGVAFAADEVVEATAVGDQFRVLCQSGSLYPAKTLLFATGIVDRIPILPVVRECLGISVYVCPDCDGYEVTERRTVVIGAGKVGANMALTLTYWTDDIVYINHEMTDLDADVRAQFNQRSIEIIASPVTRIDQTNGRIQSVVLQNGRMVRAERGFVAFGGNTVNSQVARQLGVTLHTNRHILVHPRTKMTNVPNVWAAGDVVAHSEQVTVAMGEGAQAAIWIHKRLLGEA
ncbi:thioredoxin reductase [Alicyclobacillus contaminans]|uniref:NAD(P)/FAD-dependent oxidoreductase n=1 Tax=Alicyclobacillus contaminans TaxID=392016 RepID=UPI00041C23E7|nr:NAD(P)/FAD-dependent oxidoreductase [Alicyclobacillus contaminans]GMA51208.1 thioredoxin reductase [Alicyclobacillus contaminans]